MKTISITSILLLLYSSLIYSQTFHSSVQIDTEKSWTYSKGINRENATFVIDLTKSKFSITSSFLNAQNLDLIPLDARVVYDEKGQKFLKSKYEIQNNGVSFGLSLYIEDSKIVKDELIVGKYNKAFALELIKDGKKTSFLVCTIKELDLPIKYNTKTIWCQYQSFVSDYRVESTGESEKGDVKRTKVLIEIDTVNHYVSLNSKNGYKFNFINEEVMTYMGSSWKSKKFGFENSPGEFLTIYKTDTPVSIGNSQYYMIFNLLTMDTTTNKTTSSISLFVSNSPDTNEGQNEYIPEEAPN